MTHYEILGLTREATPTQIREAYRRLAKQYHPDRFSRLSETARAFVHEKMLAINEAYEVLGDPEKRRGYDLQHNPDTVSSLAYARYVELEWKLMELLGKHKFGKQYFYPNRPGGITTEFWLRCFIHFLMFGIPSEMRKFFLFDAALVFLFYNSAAELPNSIWSSKSGRMFWFSWGIMWGWIFLVLPFFSFSSASDPWYKIPVWLFLFTQILFVWLRKRINREVYILRRQKQVEIQKEVNKIMAELIKLEREIYGRERYPFPQSQYD